MEESKDEHGKKIYLCKWVGYDNTSWELASNVKSAANELETYRAKHGKGNAKVPRKQGKFELVETTDTVYVTFEQRQLQEASLLGKRRAVQRAAAEKK